MILSDVVEMKISNNQIKFYKEKGYIVKGGNEIKEIYVKDLPNNSKAKIKVKCDICGNEKYLSLNRYMLNTKNKTVYYACCQKCMQDKVKDTNIKKYGVDNISKLKEIKEKKIETCIINHDVKHPQQSKIIFNKSLKTKYEKYGSETYNNSISMIETKLKQIKDKYAAIDYDGDEFTFQCKCGHLYKITPGLYHGRLKIKTEICTICNPYHSNISPNENFVYDFIKENYDGEIIKSDRTVLGGKELDIYLPELKLAFEYNGLYWHNELYKDKNYHWNKTETCSNMGIQLIHIYSDSWLYKQDIIKSIILNKIGKSSIKIFARKCEIRELSDNQIIRDFLDQNHIQGAINSSIKLGLFYDNELISVMIFGKKRIFMNSQSNDGEYELLRYCNKLNYNIVGGASKLFSYFLKHYKFNEIITYADRSYSQGDLYGKLGFEFVKKTQPNYYYIIKNMRFHRYNFRKDILVKKGFDSNKTEHEIMLERGINRIYDSGSLKFKLNKKYFLIN